VFVILHTVFDFFYGEWTIFAGSTLLGARWIAQGLRDTVPRDFVGEYKYAGPLFFLALGVVLQIPLGMRLLLLHASGR
jgi:hypothetical protein